MSTSMIVARSNACTRALAVALAMAIMSTAASSAPMTQAA